MYRQRELPPISEVCLPSFLRAARSFLHPSSSFPHPSSSFPHPSSSFPHPPSSFPRRRESRSWHRTVIHGSARTP